MGIFEERITVVHHPPTMHWQQQRQSGHQHNQQLPLPQQQHELQNTIGTVAYDSSRDLSPNLPPCDHQRSSPSSSSSSNSSSGCSTPNSNNNNNNQNRSCAVAAAAAAATGLHQYHHQQQQQQQQQHPAMMMMMMMPKLEPMHPGSTPPNTPPPPLDNRLPAAPCAGCGQRIVDRFYLEAVDRRWHANCLQCSHCRHTLDGEVTCFARDGNIYCKKDYYRLFGMRRCGRCQTTILSSELVMRAREFVFHVQCFSCTACGSPLTKGDHFGMRNGAILCQMHLTTTTATTPTISAASPALPPTETLHFHHHHDSGTFSADHYPAIASTPVNIIESTSLGGSAGGNFNNGGSTPPPSSSSHMPTTAITGMPARQKGRPRKRKPKDLDIMTANLDLNADYLNMSFGGRSSSTGSSGGGGLMSVSASSSAANQRSKRMRTSFKHHQLRSMKSYFTINHNPDAKDLKQLSQKTGLPKRVLQVWFQNARAKWRRMILKQECKSTTNSNINSGGGGGVTTTTTAAAASIDNNNSNSSSLVDLDVVYGSTLQHHHHHHHHHNPSASFISDGGNAPSPGFLLPPPPAAAAATSSSQPPSPSSSLDCT